MFGRLVIRAPNHLGELVLALPALEWAGSVCSERPLVQVKGELAPLLSLSAARVEPLPMEHRHRLLREALRLRSSDPRLGVLLTPSFSAALVFALAGVRHRRGTDTDARGFLLTDRVDRGPLLEGHRVREYLELVTGVTTKADPPADRSRLPVPRLSVTPDVMDGWRTVARTVGIPDSTGVLVGLVPGGRSSTSRWPVERWRELARRLSRSGVRTVAFGTADEREITDGVTRGVSGAHDVGGRTDLLELSGGLASCDVVVANDTGPMHVAAALQRPLVVIVGAGDPRQTRPLSSPVRMLGSFDLPCHPCLKNPCPREGSGFRLAEAHEECLRLVQVNDVRRELFELFDEVREGRAR